MRQPACMGPAPFIGSTIMDQNNGFDLEMKLQSNFLELFLEDRKMTHFREMKTSH